MISTNIKGFDLVFETGNELFSPKRIDKGTIAMLSLIDFDENDKVCDLGCGYGVIGILAAQIIGPSQIKMLDISDKAVNISKKNAKLNGVESVEIIKSDGFSNINDRDFTLIISHPPYHTDFSVAKMFIEKGFNRLKVGGKMYMVTKRKEWYKNKLISIFGGVKITEVDGYFIFMAEKKKSAYA